jgi:hypothetical protein
MQPFRASLSVLLFLLSQAAFLAHAISHRDAADVSQAETCTVCAAIQGLDAAPPPRVDAAVFARVSGIVPTSETPSFAATPCVFHWARAPPSA